jgi:hypothetical protein
MCSLKLVRFELDTTYINIYCDKSFEVVIITNGPRNSKNLTDKINITGYNVVPILSLKSKFIRPIIL